MELIDYVTHEMGAEQARQLQAISIGGSNNFKGSQYEHSLAAIKVCQLAEQFYSQNLDAISVSTQTVAFVDDFCVENKLTDTKINYQAKNSDGAAAKWTSAMEQRFAQQCILDSEFHKYTNCLQVLVVSSPERFVGNQQAISQASNERFAAEYIPYLLDDFSLITSFKPLQKALAALTINKEATTLDYTYQMIQTAWRYFSRREKVSIADILGYANSLSKPNFFRQDVDKRDVPDWLKNLCSAVQGLKAELIYGTVKVNYEGLTLMLDCNTEEPTELDKLRAADTTPQIGQLLEILLHLSASGLKSSKTGNIHHE